MPSVLARLKCFNGICVIRNECILIMSVNNDNNSINNDSNDNNDGYNNYNYESLD